MTVASLLKDPDILSYLDSYCRKTFASDCDADECYLYILDKLQEDDCRRLRKFDGRSTLKIWMRTTFKRQVADFMRKKFGRRRVPAAVEKIGEWAVDVYKLFCWKKRSIEDAWVAITARGLYSNPFSLYLEEVETVLENPCPQSVNMVSLDAGDDREPGGEGCNPLNLFLQKCDRERQARAAKILVQETARFSDEEKLILQMAYTEECKDSSIARVLQCDRRTVKKKRLHLLNCFREVLLQEGISGL